jgi:DNA-directed RNA polymerase subunit RPC12/RpoP
VSSVAELLKRIDVAMLARGSAVAAAGRPIDEVSRAMGVDVTLQEWTAIAAAWNRYFETDPRLHAEYVARVFALKGDRAHQLAELRALDRIRAYRCFGCGAPKRIAPRTAYVHCDFCGTLFDYDFDIMMLDHQGTDHDELTKKLIDGVRDELRAAFEAKNWAPYRELWRWVYTTDMALFPRAWSPRIGDPAYRAAMLEFVIGTAVARNQRGEADRVAQGRCEEITGHVEDAIQRGDRNAMARTLDAWMPSRIAALEEEARVYDRAGLFALHPDGLTAATYWQISRALIAAIQWKLHVPADVLTGALERFGITTSTTEAPPIAIDQASCGSCGGKLLVVAGSRALVCESCGHRLETGERAFGCPTCGARVIAKSAGETKCAWCASVFTLT